MDGRRQGIGPLQLATAILYRAGQRKQQAKLRFQCAQHPGLQPQRAAFERQMGGKLVQFVDVRRQLPAIAGHDCIALVDPQGIARPAFGVDHDRIDPRLEPSRHGAREDEAVDQRGRGDADADFLRAQAGGGEDRRLRLDRREGHDAGGIARQQEGIGARRPVEQRDEGAKPKPQRQREREKFGGIAEQRHQQDRHARADDGAEQAEHRLGRHRAGERLGNDIGGDDRPIGPVQPDPQRDIIGQHRRDKGLEREQRVMAAVAIGHPARLRQGRRHAAHPASSGGARQGGDAGRGMKAGRVGPPRRMGRALLELQANPLCACPCGETI